MECIIFSHLLDEDACAKRTFNLRRTAYATKANFLIYGELSAVLSLPHPLMVQLAQHSSDLVVVVDLNCRVIFLNNAGRTMLGMIAESLPQLTLQNIVAANLQGKLTDDIFPQAKSGQVWDGVLELCCQSRDAVIQTYCFVSAFKNEDGDVSGYAIICHGVHAEKTALERLERKAASFDAIIENCPFGLFVVDGELRVLVVSNGARSVFDGFDIASRPRHEDVVRSLWPQLFADEIVARFKTTLETGESYLAPSTIEERSDTHAMEAYDWRIDRIVLPDGSFGVACYFYDLTERQRWADETLAAKAQEAANARELEELYNEAPLGLAMVDRDFRFIRMNPAFEVMCAKSKREALGKTPWDLVPELQEKVQPILVSVLETRETVIFPIIGTLHRKLNVPREWVNQIYPVIGQDGEVTGVGFMVQDVTLQRHSEEILRASEERLRLVLDQLFTLVAILSPAGQIIYANNAGLGAANLTLEDVKGEHIAETIWWNYTPEIQATVRAGVELAGAGHVFRQDVVAKVGDACFAVDLQFAPLKNNLGDVIGIIGSGVMVEDRIQAERALRTLANNLEEQVDRRTHELLIANEKLLAERQQREAAQIALFQSQKLEAMGQLVAGVAHDFNNILASVISGLALIQRKTDDAFITEITSMSTNAARRGAGLVKQMLAFARQQPLSSQSIQVESVFDELRPLLSMTLNSSVQLIIIPPTNLWPIFVDGDTLHSALLNLAINARDAMPNGGCLTISAYNVGEAEANRPFDLKDGEFVAISIKDNGTGMSSETLAKFAEPFFTTKPQGKGTGLGVAMVHGFVNQSGGTMAVESIEGFGTTITLFLPRAQQKPAPVSLRAVDENRKTGKKILLVDDDAELRFLLATTLEESGFDVKTARSGKRALALIANSDFDLIVTDFMMPEMDGLELARAIRSLRPEQPILFVTCFSRQAQLENETVLIKPFEANELVDLINLQLSPSQLSPRQLYPR